jgi:hypothetical protein
MTINYNPIPGVISTLVGNNATCSNNPTPNFLNSQEFLCLNRWNCVIITFDGNRHKLYLNGILKMIKQHHLMLLLIVEVTFALATGGSWTLNHLKAK